MTECDRPLLQRDKNLHKADQLVSQSFTYIVFYASVLFASALINRANTKEADQVNDDASTYILANPVKYLS